MANTTLKTGKNYYLIDEETRARLVTIVGEVLAMAAHDAHDETEDEEYRTLAKTVAQGLLDLHGKLMFAEGGVCIDKRKT